MIAILLEFLLVWHHHHNHNFGPPNLKHLSSTSATNITIIAIWNPKSPEIGKWRPKSSYLANFFASVAANPQIDLLFIIYDRFGVGCTDDIVPEAMGIWNVRPVCMSFEEYWDLHTEFLCGRWTCNDQERADLFYDLTTRAWEDGVGHPPLHSPSVSQLNK